MPTLMGLPFIFGAGNQCGNVMPRWRNVPASATSTKTDTIPFQNNPNANAPMAVPSERRVAPITDPVPSFVYQAPAGGWLRSTVASNSVPCVSAES